MTGKAKFQHKRKFYYFDIYNKQNMANHKCMHSVYTVILSLGNIQQRLKVLEAV